MQLPTFVFRPVRGISAFDAGPGQHIVWTPSADRDTIQVVQYFPTHLEADLLKSFDRLQLVYPSVSAFDPVELLLKRLQHRRSA